MKNRHAFALAAALAALVLIATMIAGILFAAGQETRSTRNAILSQQAFSYAELAAARALAELNPATLTDAAVGDVSTYTPASDDPLESTVFITKLDSSLVLVVAEGRVRAADAFRLRRRVEIVARVVRDSTGFDRVIRIPENAWAAMY